MKIRRLDNQLVDWKPDGISSQDKRAKSSLHQKAKELLYQRYPTQHILEEVDIPVKQGKTLYLDFYMPMLKRAIEVHGEQHYKMVVHFHGSLKGFARQRKRDNNKQAWCELNNIDLIVLPFDKTEEWNELI